MNNNEYYQGNGSDQVVILNFNNNIKITKNT